MIALFHRERQPLIQDRYRNTTLDSTLVIIFYLFYSINSIEMMTDIIYIYKKADDLTHTLVIVIFSCLLQERLSKPYPKPFGIRRDLTRGYLKTD